MQGIAVLAEHCTHLQSIDLDGVYNIGTGAIVDVVTRRGAGLRFLAFVRVWLLSTRHLTSHRMGLALTIEHCRPYHSTPPPSPHSGMWM